MLIVENDRAAVEQALVAGRLSCPSCGGALAPWASAGPRVVRSGGAEASLTPRRGRCRSCAKTHVLLPDRCLLRRRDAVADIVTALVAKVAGHGRRRIAQRLGVPADTVRGWLRRFGERAEELRAHCWRLAHALDPALAAIDAAGSVFADAVSALGVTMRAATVRLGPRPASGWASALTGGRLLPPNTSSPFRALPGFEWVIPTN